MTFGINQIVFDSTEARYVTQLLDENGEVMRSEFVTRNTVLEAEKPKVKNTTVNFNLEKDIGNSFLNVYKENGELLMELRRFESISKGLIAINLRIEYLGEEQKNLKVVVEDTNGNVYHSQTVN
jgi:hypothetical protein